MTAWSTCSLTACEPASLLVGRNFETLTVPNLKFPNYDSACERSYCKLLHVDYSKQNELISQIYLVHETWIYTVGPTEAN